MWVQTTYPMPPEVESHTTSVWTVPDSGVYVGIMRQDIFSPPMLWLRADKKLTMAQIRVARAAAKSLHDILNEPIFFAECVDEVGRRWAAFLGFTEFHWLNNVSLHQRSE